MPTSKGRVTDYAHTENQSKEERKSITMSITNINQNKIADDGFDAENITTDFVKFYLILFGLHSDEYNLEDVVNDWKGIVKSGYQLALYVSAGPRVTRPTHDTRGYINRVRERGFDALTSCDVRHAMAHDDENSTATCIYCGGTAWELGVDCGPALSIEQMYRVYLDTPGGAM